MAGRIKTDPDAFYRVIHGDSAYQDILNSGKVRTNYNAKPKPNTGGGVSLANRPTAFPSFSKGEIALRYAESNPNHYVIATKDPSIKPSTRSRHGKGSTMFPTGKDGKHLTELPSDKVDVYKHVGKGQYKKVLERGAVPKPGFVERNLPNVAKAFEEGLTTPAGRSAASQAGANLLKGALSSGNVLFTGLTYSPDLNAGEDEIIKKRIEQEAIEKAATQSKTKLEDVGLPYTYKINKPASVSFRHGGRVSPAKASVQAPVKRKGIDGCAIRGMTKRGRK
jgi:hypothetical protein